SAKLRKVRYELVNGRSSLEDALNAVPDTPRRGGCRAGGATRGRRPRRYLRFLHDRGRDFLEYVHFRERRGPGNAVDSKTVLLLELLDRLLGAGTELTVRGHTKRLLQLLHGFARRVDLEQDQFV